MSNLQVRDPGRIAWGVVIGAFGLLLLFDRFGGTDFRFSGDFWPFVLIALGAVRLMQPPDLAAGRPRRSGSMLLAVGAWALATELHLWGLTFQNSWPILIVGVGLSMVWGALRGQSFCGHGRPRGPHAA
jgi:hypothetical protein